MPSIATPDLLTGLRTRSARPKADRIDDSGELLIGALERAVVTARQDAGSRDAPPPPAALRPVLRFARLPTRALRTVREALDRDESFRTRVAAGADETEIGRASWLFLERPDGWAEELELLSAAASEERQDEQATRREQTAERRLAQLETTVERMRADATRVERTAADTERALVEERAARLSAESERAELRTKVSELEAERARAVKSLKATEASAADRLSDLRVARERVAELEAAVQQESQPSAPVEVAVESPPAPLEIVVPAVSPWDSIDPAAVADAVQRAADVTTQLAAVLAEAGSALRPAPGAFSSTVTGQQEADPGGAAVTDGRSTGGRVRPSRRTPIRLRGGVHEGTAEGLEQLAGTTGVVVIVDGYNVTMEGWPSLDHSRQRESLIAALGSLQKRSGAAIHVVFDGDDDGRRPAVGAPLPVRVHFSQVDVEADDVILSMVARLPTDVPVVVISSDRRVADGARRLGANAVRSSELLDLVRR